MIQLIDLAAYKIIKAVRLDGWVLRRKLAETPAAGTVEGLSERSEAGLGELCELPSSSASCAPWSSGNNCTRENVQI
ncbi:hypothetical protein ACK367_04790 [Aeromonas veronii]